MPRPGRRISLTIAAAALALLALPAAAQAADYTVSAGNGACAAPGDLQCGTLIDATTAVNAGAGGDTVTVLPGTYAESPSFTKPNTTISGAGAGVVISGAVTFSGAGAVASVLEKVTVVSLTGATPAVTISAAYGVALRDAVLVSGGGNGVTITAGNNAIVRSQVFAGGGAANAVDVSSTTTALTTTLESTILAGTGGGAGLKVKTNNNGLVLGSAADGTVNARHVTIAGSTAGMLLDASNAATLLTAVGNITVNTSDSIVLGNVVKVPALLVTPNAVTATFTRTDQTTQSEKLFVNPGAKNFHLRADAPVIDQGQISGGESTTDVDGESRTAGPASDLGADEFVNKPPTARIRVVTTTPRDGQPVQFDGSGSTDQVGDAIVGYVWDFGDGQKQTTATPTVTHTYKGEGPITASLVAVDRRGATSAADSTKLTILDGTAPAVVITKPRKSQKISVITRRTRTVKKNGRKTKVTTSRRTRIGFAGAASDKSGVLIVFLTVEKVSNPSKTTVAQGSQAGSKTTCTWLDPKKGLRKTSCAKPITITVKLAGNGVWSYNVAKGILLSKGGYRATVYGLDKTGAFGNSAPQANSTISFTLR